MMENARANWRMLTLSTSPKYFLETIAVSSLLVVVIVLLNSQQEQYQNLIPTLGLFALAVIRLIPSFSHLLTYFHQLNFLSVSVDAVYEAVKGLEMEQTQKQENLGALTFKEKISIQGASYYFTEADRSVLENVSLVIPFNKSIALVGSSGAGKTTLANLIMGMLTPSSGKILVDGNDINSNIQAWRKMIGYVPQSIYLLDASVRENIAFGLEVNEINDSKVWDALKTTRLDDVIRNLPKGLDTFVGEDGVRMSGGQRQRMGIARAIYHQPDILVLDEATSALDNETEKGVSLAIDRLSGQKTLIIIAHRLSTVEKCDCIYFMRDGYIADSGTFSELMSKNPEFRKMAAVEEKA